MDYRQLARFLAAGRLLVGAATLVAPGRVLGVLGGERSGGAELVARAFAGRELVLGAGVLWSLDHHADSRHWVVAASAADAVDAVASLLALRAIGARRALAGTAVALAAAAAGQRAADRLE